MNALLATLRIEVQTMATANCGREWDYSFVNTPFSRLYHTLGGEGIAVYNDRCYRLRPGFLHIIPENMNVRLHCASQMDQFYMHFKTELLGGLSFFKVFDCEYELPLADSPGLMEDIARLEKLNFRSDLSSAMETEGILRSVLSRFIRNKQSMEASLELVRFRPVFEYIERNYSKKLRLKDLSMRANLQEVYFSNLFKRLCGTTPMQFLNRKRIEKAQSLLLSSDEKLEEIAGRCGFDDSFHFSKTFKKFTGLPPSDYRRNRQAQLS